MSFITFPVDFKDDDFFFPRLTEIAACLTATLEDEGGPGFCYSGLMFGQQNMPLGLVDQGQNLGVAWVRPVTTFPSTTFPLPDDPSTRIACRAGFAMEIEIGVARCAPRARDRSMYVDPQDVFEATRLYMADMQAMKRAVLCCYKPSHPEALVAFGVWTPLEVAAGITGGTWQAWIG
jgi:hypothetical protein